MSTTTQTLMHLTPPLASASSTMDLKALNEYRRQYQRFRQGETKGARIQAQNNIKNLQKRMSSLPTATAKDDGEDSIGSGSSLDKAETRHNARSVQPPGNTKYELARDVQINHDIDQSMNFEARFERYRLMRSDVLVEFNAIEQLATRALDIIPRKCHRSPIYIITDSVTDEVCGASVHDGMLSAGLNVTKFVVPSETDDSGETSTEETKTLATFARLADQVLQSGVDKRSAIVSLGGGVVNNICGYLAASIYRGITLIHFSTTFMGQVDAAIDFKQAVNHCCGKNLLGCYYPATKIVLDPTVLLTQSFRHRRNGLAEALKHGMVHSTSLLEYIVNGGDISDPKYLDGVVRRTIAVKVPTLTRYEESDFNEMAPQYGHAPAHAIEFLSWHGGCPENGPILHGEAVAIGMCVSAEVAHIMGICTKDVVEDHYRIVESIGLPSCTPSEMDVEAIIAKLAYDKHTLSGKPTMGLLRKMGDMYEENGRYGQPVDPTVLRLAFENNMKRGEQTLN